MNSMRNETTILITGLHRTVDNGEFLLLIGLVRGLEREFSDHKFRIYLLCDYGRVDEIRIKKALLNCNNIEVKVIYPLGTQYILPILRIALYIPLILKSHIVIHLGADGFSDEAAGGPLSTIYHGLQILIAHFLRRPVILLSATIGPFKTSNTRSYALFILKRVSGLTIRQGSSELYLKELGLRNFIPVADLAFLISNSKSAVAPTKGKSSFYERPLASIVVNKHIYNRFPKYIDAMALVVDRLCDKGFNVLIIPQIIHGKYDEIPIARAIQRKTVHKNNIEIAENICPSDMIELFHRSEIVVSSKYHSSIISFLTLTPTITLNYHPKVRDLHEMLDVSDCLVEITRDYSAFLAELLEKIETVLNKKGVIRNKIENNLSMCIVRSIKNIKLIHNWLYPQTRSCTVA